MSILKQIRFAGSVVMIAGFFMPFPTKLEVCLIGMLIQYFGALVSIDMLENKVAKLEKTNESL